MLVSVLFSWLYLVADFLTIYDQSLSMLQTDRNTPALRSVICRRLCHARIWSFQLYIQHLEPDWVYCQPGPDKHLPVSEILNRNDTFDHRLILFCYIVRFSNLATTTSFLEYSTMYHTLRLFLPARFCLFLNV